MFHCNIALARGMILFNRLRTTNLVPMDPSSGQSWAIRFDQAFAAYTEWYAYAGYMTQPPQPFVHPSAEQVPLFLIVLFPNLLCIRFLKGRLLATL